MRECDLVMKGGVTSGVVYPFAITELSQDYRFRNVGGTSAGAIAAVFAGAAEYRRQTAPAGQERSGFAAIEALGLQSGGSMLSLFQPSLPFRSAFAIAVTTLERAKTLGIAKALALSVLTSAWPVTLSALVFGCLVFLPGLASGNPLSLVLSAIGGLATAGLVAALLLALALWRLVRALPAFGFGMCSGLAQGDGTKPGLTDWVTDQIDRIAGNVDETGQPSDPLLVGQLLAKGIRVAAVTTDLSSGRPFQLPLSAKLHLFSPQEFRKLFPARVVDYLVRAGGALDRTAPGIPDDLHWLPVGDAFPVVLVARMSLSFPGLIQAVPLYRYDDQLKIEPAEHKIRRCLFSDGGISSNFPIHFFDSFLPKRPTFGISLSAWDKLRHGDKRVELPQKWKQSTDLPIRPITGLGGFLMAILGAAKDWQDTLQSLLPGYAERIVDIRLDDAEGGLNLDMSTETVEALTGYGRQAGTALLEQFDFDEHRYRRALTLLPKLEQTLETFAETYDGAPVGGGLNYGAVLREHPAGSYKGNSKTWRRDVFDAFAEALAKLGRQAAINQAAPGISSVREGDTPKVDSTIRVVADTDRVPMGGE